MCRGAGAYRQVFTAACDELARVTKQYLVVGVPYRQDTRVGAPPVPIVAQLIPPWGHVNIFDETRLNSLFANWMSWDEASYVRQNRSATNVSSLSWTGRGTLMELTTRRSRVWSAARNCSVQSREAYSGTRHVQCDSFQPDSVGFDATPRQLDSRAVCKAITACDCILSQTMRCSIPVAMHVGGSICRIQSARCAWTIWHCRRCSHFARRAIVDSHPSMTFGKSNSDSSVFDHVAA